MEPTKKKKPSRFISVRLPAMLKRSERRESGSLSAHAQLCSRELPKVESTLIRTFICGKILDGASFEYVTSSFTHAAIMGRMHNPGYGTINSFSCVLHQTRGAKL